MQIKVKIVLRKVFLQDKFTKTWFKGTIIKKLNEPRSYLIKNQNEWFLRRNTIFIKKLRVRDKNNIGQKGVKDTIKLKTVRHSDKIKQKYYQNKHKTRLGKKVVKPYKLNL